MSDMLSFRFALPSFLSWGAREPTREIDIPSVEIANIETGSDKRTRTLKHLIKANHTNFSIIYNELRFHNHMPHVCLTSNPRHKPARFLFPFQELGIEHLAKYQLDPRICIFLFVYTRASQ